MGGFATLAGETLEKLGDKAVSGLEQTSVGRGLLNLAGNKEYELNLTPEGQAINKMNGEYIRLHSQALQAETQKLKAIRDWHQGDAQARAAVPASASINQFHAHAVATQHPIAKVTGQIVADGDGALNQKELMIKNMQKARLAALPGSYGANFEHAAPLVARLLQHPNPEIQINGQRVADIISNEVRDPRHYTSYTGQSGEESIAKVSMNKAFQSANKVFEKLDMPTIPLLRDTHSTYTKPTETERTVHRVVNMMLTPFVAIPHIGQLFNLPASSPLTAIGKALMGMNHQEMTDTVEASSITASTLWQSMYRDILGEQGKVAEWTNSPTVGRILAKSVHQPGFSWLRKTQLNAAGAVGFHSAIYWAHNFVESGSKIAEARLKEMDIDPLEVKSQGGQLTEAQLQKGIFHYVNNRMFFQKSIDNSLYQNRNVVARGFYMYHSFVNSQMNFMRREMMLMLKAGDIKGIAQFAGTVGILFPAVAPLLSGAEVLARTGSLQQGGKEVQSRYKRLIHPSGVGDWTQNYLALLAHLGAAGVYFNFARALQANRLVEAGAGPIPTLIGTDSYDLYHAFTTEKSGKHPVEPLERDALKQGVPVIGSELAHTLLPTKAEKGSSSSTNRFRHHFGRRGRRF